jgi:hypothetical protein
MPATRRESARDRVNVLPQTRYGKILAGARDHKAPLPETCAAAPAESETAAAAWLCKLPPTPWQTPRRGRACLRPRCCRSKKQGLATPRRGRTASAECRAGLPGWGMNRRVGRTEAGALGTFDPRTKQAILACSRAVQTRSSETTAVVLVDGRVTDAILDAAVGSIAVCGVGRSRAAVDGRIRASGAGA